MNAVREPAAVRRGTEPARAFTTRGTFFGPDARPVAGWWTTPRDASHDAVVIAPPLGYEYWSTHRSLRTLAEALARAGWNVLRFDWDGTGDSAGEATDPDRVAMWRASLAHAVAATRAAGMTRVHLIGFRLGAALALTEAAALGVEGVAACAPVAGRRFVRELKMLGIVDAQNPGGVMYSGLVIDPATAADLATIDPGKHPPPPVPRTLVMTRPEVQDKLAEALRADGRELTTVVCGDMRAMLDVPSEDSAVPTGLIPPLAAWLGAPRRDAGATPPACRAARDIPWRGGRVRETFTDVDGLVAVRSETVDAHGDCVTVFLNSGSEPHIGPGRAWVEYARSLALQGQTCVRVDFHGWGESPDAGYPRGRPYDPQCVPETQHIVAALRRQFPRVVLAGLCAGAWVAMKAAQRTRVDGVFALNPQLYWKPGMGIVIRIPEAIQARAPSRERQRKLARWKVWSILDALWIRPMAAHWLIALRRRRTPVLMSFADGDDGLVFLRDRCGRRLARELRSGYLAVEEVPGIDHQMYRVWRRHAIIEQLVRFLAALPPAGSARPR